MIARPRRGSVLGELPSVTAPPRLRRSIRGAVRLLVLYLGFSIGIACVRVSGAQDVSDGWYPKILEQNRAQQAEVVSTTANDPFLPDFSYAGYRWGEVPLPEASGTVIDVTDYGAIPNNGEDDTIAIRGALAAAHRIDGDVIVSFPPGRFIVREILYIERSNIVLQGSGSGANGTELHFPRPLTEMELPEEYQGLRPHGRSQFSWRGGVIWTQQSEPPVQQEIARGVAGRRGHHTVKVDRTPNLEPGDIVQLQWYNQDGHDSSLLHHVYCPTNLSFGRNLYRHPDLPLITQEVTVERVHSTTLIIKEPLLHDVREMWNPTIKTVDFLKEVGIEHLRITFPLVEYGGHLHEAGYNGIFIGELAHSWVRDVVIENADSGILSRQSKNFTVEGVEIRGRGGHYSVHLGNVYGGMVRNFTLDTPSMHNPSFNTRCRASVYTDGTIRDAMLDQHMGGNHQNIFENLSVRYARPDDMLFRNSGDHVSWGPDAGAFNTFWNIRVEFDEVSESDPPVMVGRIEGAPHARLVGLTGNVPIEFEYGPYPYIEGTNESSISVPSLYEYQLERRLSGDIAPSLAIFSPHAESHNSEQEPVLIKADLRGDFDPVEVRFFVNGEDIGVGVEEDGRWSILWEDHTAGYHAVTAVARDADGNTLSARPLSCTGEPVRFWIGDEVKILHDNYPNPFRTFTTIRYTLPETGRVVIDLYDVLGRRVKKVLDEVQVAGEREVSFDARSLSSGVYFYDIRTKSYRGSGKAVMVR